MQVNSNIYWENMPLPVPYHSLISQLQSQITDLVPKMHDSIELHFKIPRNISETTHFNCLNAHLFHKRHVKNSTLQHPTAIKYLVNEKIRLIL